MIIEDIRSESIIIIDSQKYFVQGWVGDPLSNNAYCLLCLLDNNSDLKMIRDSLITTHDIHISQITKAIEEGKLSLCQS